MSGFSNDQVMALQAKLQAKYVRERQSKGGFSLSYLAGWHVISEANRIFGFDGWDRETIASDCVWHAAGREPACSYVAKVRIRVRAGDQIIVREGCGFGMGTGATLGESHGKALKEAETDATKRALATFGNPFGLALYDRDQTQVTGRKAKKRWLLHGTDGLPVKTYTDPYAYYAAAHNLLARATTEQEVRQLWFGNEQTFRDLRDRYPDLRNDNGVHFTVLFCRACRPHLEAIKSASTNAACSTVGTDRNEIDSSWDAMNHPADQRLPRAKAGATTANGADLNSQDPGLSNEPAIDALSGYPVQSWAVKTVDLLTNAAGSGDRQTFVGSATVTVERPFGKPQRLRDREHLIRVASLPCSVCSSPPSHAHHLTFAQPRARGLKVSDEWTVPLCASHHRELHDHGNELVWWQSRSLDPIAIARELWAESRNATAADHSRGHG